MRLPDPPQLGDLSQLSPTLYETALACQARAAWTAFGDRGTVPQHPKALLGTCVHAVVEAAHKGQLPPPEREEDHGRTAREIFDRAAGELLARAHPLLRAKFGSPERLPFYNLFRERAVLLAREASGPSGRARGAGPSAEVPPVQGQPLVEARLVSGDGLLAGRADYIDPQASEVVDYKTSAGPEDAPHGVSDAEARQLRLYVHLARDAGLDVTKGVVVRANGRRAVIAVSEAEASAEGQRARELLKALRANAGRGFDELAEPDAAACPHCPCMPFCNPFWASASAAWAEQCGTHVEGTVSGVSRSVMQNTTLLTLEIAVERGTASPGRAVIQQMPEAWVTSGGALPPEPGDVIRLVHCHVADPVDGLSVIRCDRVSTALWTVRRHADQTGEGSDGLSDG